MSPADVDSSDIAGVIGHVDLALGLLYAGGVTAMTFKPAYG